MNRPVAIAQFGRPTDAELLRLQNELEASGIVFAVDGAIGKFGFDAQLTFDIKVFVDEVDADRAVEICRGIQNTEKTKLPSFCPKCDSPEVMELSYRPILFIDGWERKFKCNKCGKIWKG